MNTQIQSLFNRMKLDKSISSKNNGMYITMGPGVWLLYGSSIYSLLTVDISKAVYIPLASVDMLVNDATLKNTRYDPMKELLVLCLYMKPEEKRSAYVWTKLTV